MLLAQLQSTSLTKYIPIDIHIIDIEQTIYTKSIYMKI
jgi:hypothetical protein